MRSDGAAIGPTLIERINSALPIPYFITAFIFAALLGPVGFYLADLLSYLDFGKATALFLNSSIDHYTFSQLVGNNIIYPAIIFYCAFMIRYMRRRILRVEEDLEGSTPEWKEKIRVSFGWISRTAPALVVTGIIFVLSYPLVYFQVSNNQGLAQLYFAVTYPLFFFGAGTFIWVYVASLWGLYRVGRQPLKLRPYSEDALLGLGGFGAISLTLTLVFLIAVFFAIYEFSVFATAMPFALTVVFSGFLILVGVVMFFLPLMNFHRQMVGERDRLHSRNLRALVDLISEKAGVGAHATADDLRTVLLLEHQEEQIQGISSWPFDANIIRSLAVIVLGVVISVSAHLLTVFLNL